MRQLIKAVTISLVLSPLLFARNHRLVRIDFPNAVATQAQGINARGDIVGRYDDSAGNTHGFLLRDGMFSPIDFPNASFTTARGINARGDIVGRTIDQAGNEHGFLLRDGHFTLIDYPRAAATTARGINNAGDITGRHFDAAGNESGFVLQAGTYHNISVPNSLTPLHPCSTDVWMMQDNERVLLGDFCTDADGGIHGYLRIKPGEFQIVDFPKAGAPCSALRWINERGDIVGVYANTLDECFAFQAHGFLLQDGRFTAIDFPGSVFTDAFSINDDGIIVGDYTDKEGVQHGFKAMPND
jgi:probable HAF family extracellular repeat protein